MTKGAQRERELNFERKRAVYCLSKRLCVAEPENNKSEAFHNVSLLLYIAEAVEWDSGQRFLPLNTLKSILFS